MIRLFATQHKNIFMILFLFISGVIVFPLQVCAEKTEKKAPSCAQITKRDPFWPVGYVSKRVIKSGSRKEGPVNWEEARKNVKINGIVRRKDEYVVIINSRVKKIGDVVIFDFKGYRYKWVIESITPPHSVKLRAEKGKGNKIVQ